MFDHKARQQAALAHQKIDDHEEHCAERWREVRDQMREMRDDVRGLRQTSRSTLVILIGWGFVALLFVWERMV